MMAPKQPESMMTLLVLVFQITLSWHQHTPLLWFQLCFAVFSYMLINHPSSNLPINYLVFDRLKSTFAGRSLAACERSKVS